MLQDPENPYEEWTVDLFAPDQATAERYCQNVADSADLIDVINVEQVTQTPRNGNFKFRCYFRGEIYDGGNDSRN